MVYYLLPMVPEFDFFRRLSLLTIVAESWLVVKDIYSS